MKGHDNRDFIAASMSSAIPRMQYELVTVALDKATYGFASSSNSDCLLSVVTMLEHALDNYKVMSKERFSNITNLYNKTVYESNA